MQHEPAVAALLARIDDRFERDVERLRDLLRMPSVSATGEGIAATAERIAGWIEAAGGDAELLATDGHPIVVGNFAGPPRAPRLLRYAMYDVQPAEEPDWTSPPFAAEIRDLPGRGPSIVARGAANSKSTLAAQLIAIEVLRELGGLPAGVVLLAEGEEELGSPHLPDAVAAHADRFAVDAAFDLDVGAESVDRWELILGCKGLVSLHAAAEAGPWGGPARPLHSSEQAWIASPAWELVRALSTLIDSRQDPAVPALRVRLEPSSADARLLDQLAAGLDPEAHLAAVGAARFRVDGDPAARLRELLFKPSINLDGIAAGYVGPGGKTIIPARAEAMLEIRLVPGQRPEQIAQAVREHLDDHGFGHVRTRVTDAYPPAKATAGNPVARAVDATCARVGAELVPYPLAPWCAPYHVFDQLGLDWAVANVGEGGGAHGPDEFVTLEGFRAHLRATTLLLYELGRTLSPRAALR